MSGLLLEIDHLQVEIRGQTALHDVVLSVPRGGSVGIVGETGSGKSLTCRAIIGLLGRIGARIASGTVAFDGADLTALPEAGWRQLRGRRIGLVPQSSLASLDPVMRIGRQMAEAVRTIDRDSDPRQRSIELLEAVQMPRGDAVLRLYPHELSGGMRQRVMIALALVGRPDLLVADEATTALDVTIQRTILELLDGLRQDLGMALLLVTHDLAVVESICETVTVMYAGATVELGPAAGLDANALHPYTRALVAAQPSVSDKSRLTAIAGAPPALGEVADGCAFAPRCQFATEVCVHGHLSLDTVSSVHQVACRRLAEIRA